MKTSDQRKLRWYQRLPLSIRGKLLVAFVGLTLVPMLLLGSLILDRTEQVLRERIAQELRVEVATAAGAVEDFLSGVGREVRSLARFLNRRLHAEMSEQQWQLVKEEFLETLRGEEAYYQVRFISDDGMERIRVNNEAGRLSLVAADQLQDKSDRYYVQDTLMLQPGQVYLSHLDFNIEFGEIEIPRRLVVRVATPVEYASGRRGLIIINVFGEELLGALRELLTVDGRRVMLLSQGRRFVEMQNRSDGPRFLTAGSLELEKILGGSIELPRPDESPRVFAAGTNLFAVAPLSAGPDRLWYLAKLYPQGQIYAELEQLQLTSIFMVLPLVLLAAILAVLAARSFSRPIRLLSRFADRVAGGDYQPRSSFYARDELGQLSEALNQMAASLEQSRERLVDWNRKLQEEVERKVADLEHSRADAEKIRQAMLALEKQLLQADRLASLGMLSATIAHEIGNPLAGLKVRLQMLKRSVKEDEPLHRDYARMLALVDRLGDFLEHLTGYVAPPVHKGQEQTDLGRVLQDIEFILREEADRREVSLKIDLPDKPLPVCSRDQHLHQIFMNLVLNGLQAVEKQGQVYVSVKSQPEEICVLIRDNGCGLPETDKERIFEPLFTTKEKGTGLGLAIVRKLVEELEGTIELNNRAEGGAEARVCLPERSSGCPKEF